MHIFFTRMDLQAKGIWFPLLIALLLILYVLVMKKRQLTWRQIYMTFGVVCGAAWILDIISAIYFETFVYGSNHGIGIADLLVISTVPSCLAIIYLNYWTVARRWVLPILFTLISLLIEWLAITAGYYRHLYWGMHYSLINFFIIYRWLLPLHKRAIGAHHAHI
ncbi:hypothetical protein [Sporolactobacillus terrae]|uniref:Uncharacterized protein n=1 Tax=Sporolactobacillus terrae TaxID=269673 RepID=A0A5K7WYI6_9BACL|nr:hypothetical protein [Sporolactobacillus terrae]BBN99685.1 hypothetical protein St703_23900 [Sporolactobacillus terrae]